MRYLLSVLAITVATAHADPAPTLAVDIEPRDDTASKAADTVAVALRAGKGRYHNKGSAKEVAAAVAKAECVATLPACAAKVGEALGVDYVLAGEVETRGKHLVLVLNVISATTKQRVRSLRDTVATSVDLRKWAKSAYARLFDEATGQIVIVANAQRGDVLLDGLSVAALFDGRATLTNIALGSHQLSIRAAGYKAIDVDVTVDGSTQQNLLLDPE